MLSAKEIDALSPQTKPFRVKDSYGLALVVHPSGAKYWVASVKIDGKNTTKSVGKYPDVSAVAARKKVALLTSEQAKAKSGQSFGTLAQEWHKVAASKLSSEKYAAQIWARMEKDVLPVIGDTDVARITRKDLIKCIQTVAERGAVETAKRLSQYVERVLDHAVDTGLIDVHPGANLGRVLPSANKGHHAALKPSESGELFKAMWSYQGGIVVASALRILAMTFLRSRELVGARWNEFDGDFWVIPGERMKRRIDHVVPLSTQSKAVFQRLREVTGDGEFVFATKHGHLHVETPRLTVRELGYRGRQTAHGFRSIFSSAAYESKLWSSGAIERQLSHKETDEVVAAYNRAEFLPERVEMMQWWSDWIETQISMVSKVN